MCETRRKAGDPSGSEHTLDEEAPLRSLLELEKTDSSGATPRTVHHHRLRGPGPRLLCQVRPRAGVKWSWWLRRAFLSSTFLSSGASSGRARAKPWTGVPSSWEGTPSHSDTLRVRPAASTHSQNRTRQTQGHHLSVPEALGPGSSRIHPMSAVNGPRFLHS